MLTIGSFAVMFFFCLAAFQLHRTHIGSIVKSNNAFYLFEYVFRRNCVGTVFYKPILRNSAPIWWKSEKSSSKNHSFPYNYTVMAPRRGKKASTAATAAPVSASIDDVPNDTEQINAKPAKTEAKKKTTKDAKKVEQSVNDNVVVAADAKIKTKKAPAKKDPKSTEQSVQNGGENSDDHATVAIKADTKSKKAPAKKNLKQIDQNGDDAKDEVAVPVPVQSKSKKPPAKKSAKQTEQPVEVVANEEAVPAVEKGKKRGAKAKPKQEEPTKAESKATKGKPKKAEQNPTEDVEIEAGPSKAAKKSTKAKSAKAVEAENEPVEEVAKPKNKRGAKKEPSAEKPIESKKPTKGNAKKADAAKSTAAATKSNANNVDENEKYDSVKDRKRKPNKTTTSPAKKAKKETADVSTVAVKSSKPEANGEPTKRKADSTTNDDKMVTKRKKAAKEEIKNEPKAKMNAVTTDYSEINFDTDKNFNFKIVSWNVAGLRALVAKDGLDYFEHEKPDVICLQEIKCLEEEVPEKAKLKGYHPYWCPTAGGRGGVCILTKNMPLDVETNIGNEEMDEEGRIITAEYSKFYLICVYVPNAGRKLVNLERRLRWNKLFEEHVLKLKQLKPVIICGDMNVAHEEIDLANPRTNTKNAGFSKEEREGMTDFLSLGFVDTFRDLYPDQEKAYTFWTYMGGARAKNVGWRLDYCLVSDNLKPKVVDSFMRPQILGSDHCPIVLTMNI